MPLLKTRGSRSKVQLFFDICVFFSVKCVYWGFLLVLLNIYPKVLEVGRKFGKVDVEIYNENTLVGKVLMMCQLIERV